MAIARWALIQASKNVGLNCDQSFHDDIFDLCEDKIIADASNVIGLLESFEAPFARILFVLTRALVYFKVLRLLIH